jgi:hypothetical protein
MSELLTAGSKDDEIARTAKSIEQVAGSIERIKRRILYQCESDMQNVTTSHVEPLVLWQFACGGRDLSKRDFQHLSGCPDCETLANEITEALHDIEKTLAGRHPSTGPS